MESTPVSFDENVEQPHENDGNGQFIRVILADTQAIFRAGLRKIFALEDDIRVVGQAETLAQTLSAAKKFSADILIFESALAPDPVEAVSDLLRQNAGLKLVVVTPEANEELTLDLFRRGAQGIVSREVEPELLVDCLRKVAQGESWLDSKGIHWVMEAYRTQGTRPTRIPAQGAADAERIADRFLRHAGNEEQRDRRARRHHRAGGEELSAQGLRQAGRGRPAGTGTLLPAQPGAGWRGQASSGRSVCEQLRLPKIATARQRRRQLELVARLPTNSLRSPHILP